MGWPFGFPVLRKLYRIAALELSAESQGITTSQLLTSADDLRNILSRACASGSPGAHHREIDGVSSNGRTAVSGAVCGGSTPPTPAISTQRLTYVAPSSSGLGRRPLKAEVAGSNPVGATRNPRSAHYVAGLFLTGDASQVLVKDRSWFRSSSYTHSLVIPECHSVIHRYRASHRFRLAVYR